MTGEGAGVYAVPAVTVFGFDQGHVSVMDSELSSNTHECTECYELLSLNRYSFLSLLEKKNCLNFVNIAEYRK